MTEFLECTFLIPICRDENLSDGDEHEPEDWAWLDDELFDRFGGVTYSLLLYRGAYTDPDTHERVVDESKKYTVAIEETRVAELRQLLAVACIFFRQKLIYLSVAGRVEFIGPPES
jgi:hypothetical protein